MPSINVAAKSMYKIIETGEKKRSVITRGNVVYHTSHSEAYHRYNKVYYREHIEI